MALLMSALNSEKINPCQVLQLLNCFDSFAAYTDWHPKSQTPFINNLKKQLELYPKCKFSIEEMAQHAFISKYHFIRKFKAEVGLTPHQFQLQNRIRKAQRLMKYPAALLRCKFDAPLLVAGYLTDSVPACLISYKQA